MTTATPTMQVRPATPKDFSALQQMHDLLCRHEREHGYDRSLPVGISFTPAMVEHFENRIGGDGIALLADVEGKLVGYLLGATCEGRAGAVGILESVFVLPNHRRKGIGAELVREFVARCERENLRSISASVAPKNAAATALLEQLGLGITSWMLEKRLD